MRPNDFGKIVEWSRSVRIEDFVQEATKTIKLQLIFSQLEANDYHVQLTTSKTRFNGERYWFVCPQCQRRSGVLYQNQSNGLGCRQCLGLKYLGQRFKGMIENKV